MTNSYRFIEINSPVPRSGHFFLNELNFPYKLGLRPNKFINLKCNHILLLGQVTAHEKTFKIP